MHNYGFYASAGASRWEKEPEWKRMRKSPEKTIGHWQSNDTLTTTTATTGVVRRRVNSNPDSGKSYDQTPRVSYGGLEKFSELNASKTKVMVIDFHENSV